MLGVTRHGLQKQDVCITVTSFMCVNVFVKENSCAHVCILVNLIFQTEPAYVIYVPISLSKSVATEHTNMRVQST